MRIPHEQRAAGREGEKVRPGIRRRLLADRAAVIELDPVEHHESSARVRIARHERLREVIEAGPVDHHARPPHGIDQRAPGRVPHDIHLAAFRAVHEGLPDIAEHDETAPLHDLAQLVLAAVVYAELHAVHAGRDVVARASEKVQPHIACRGSEPAPREPLPLQPVNRHAPPTEPVRRHGKPRIPFVAFGRKIPREKDERGFAVARRPQVLSRVPLDPHRRVPRFAIGPGHGVKDQVYRVANDLQNDAALLSPAIITAVVEQGENLESPLERARIFFNGEANGGQERAQRVEIPRRDQRNHPPKSVFGGFAGRQRDGTIRRPGRLPAPFAGRTMNARSELVRADQFARAAFLFQREDERAAIRVAAAAGVPVTVRHGPKPRVFRGERLQCRIDRLLLGRHQSDGHLALLQRKDLRPQHRGVGDAEQANAVRIGLRRRDDEEPRPVGRAAHVHPLDCAVHLFLLFREPVEIEFRGRRDGFDRVLERIAVRARQQVEQQHGHFRVGQKQRRDAVLAQVLADAEVVREIAVVHERLIHADERMRARRVPHAPLRRVTLVRDPDARGRVFEAVILHDLLGVADDLEDHQVPRVRHHEGRLLAQRRVELLVQPKAVAVDELVFRGPRRRPGKPVFLDKTREHIVPHANEIPQHIRRPHLQPRVAEVARRRDLLAVRDMKVRENERFLDLFLDGGIEQRHLQQAVRFQRFRIHAELLRHEARGGDASALAVAAIVHLDRRLEDVPARNGHRGGEPDDPASALLLHPFLASRSRRGYAVAYARCEQRLAPIAHRAPPRLS